MEIDLIELWQEMGLPVKMVVLVLTVQAVSCIAVTFDRLVLLTRSGRRSALFAEEATVLIERGRMEQLLLLASKTAGSHLASFMYTGVKTFLDRLNAGDDREKAAERTRRALDRKGETLSSALNRGMGVLASTGSTAPFVGLLGTVLGIINAFGLMAEEGQGGIGTIGAAIGEALIVTGYGLLVAIPTVLVFNWLSNRIAAFESGLVNAASELVDRLEADEITPEERTSRESGAETERAAMQEAPETAAVGEAVA